MYSFCIHSLSFTWDIDIDLSDSVISLVFAIYTLSVRSRLERSCFYVSDLERLFKFPNVHQFTYEIPSHTRQDTFRCGKYVRIVISNFVNDLVGCLVFNGKNGVFSRYLLDKPGKLVTLFGIYERS